MSDDEGRTTVTAPPSVRDRAKGLRKVDEEPIWKVIDRALDALEGDGGGDPPADVEFLAERIEAMDTVEYDDLVKANRQALRKELPERVLRE